MSIKFTTLLILQDEGRCCCIACLVNSPAILRPKFLQVITIPAKDFAHLDHVVQQQDRIKILVWTRLLAKQCINSPPAGQPNVNPIVQKAATETYDIFSVDHFASQLYGGYCIGMTFTLSGKSKAKSSKVL